MRLRFRPLNPENIPPLAGVIFVRLWNSSLTQFVGVSRDNNPAESWNVFPAIATSMRDAFGNSHFSGIRLLAPRGNGIENGVTLGESWMRNVEWATPEYGD